MILDESQLVVVYLVSKFKIEIDEEFKAEEKAT